MPQNQQKELDKFNSFTFRYKTPQGTAWIQIIESEIGKIEFIKITVGKAGSDINALCMAISELVSVLIRDGKSISTIISIFSGITSDKLLKLSGQNIHTPLDALVIALIKYRASIPDELEKESLERHLSRVR